MSHLDVESEVRRCLLGQGKGIWQCQDTEEKTAGMPGGFMKLPVVGFHPSSSAYMAHDASDSDSGSQSGSLAP